MIDEEYVKTFDIRNFMNIGIGVVIFGMPWLVFKEFWETTINIPLWKWILALILGSIVTFLTFLTVLLKRYKLGKAVKIVIRKSVFSIATVLVYDIGLLVAVGRITLVEPASVFSRVLISTLFICSASGIAFDILAYH